MRSFIRFLSFRSFIVGALVVGLVLVFLLARDDLSTTDVLLLAAYVVGCVLLTHWLRTPPQSQSNFDALASFDRVLLEGRPTLVEFYSDYCAACMANRPILDRLEMEVEHRLQILRVNVYDSAIGLALANRYDVTFTPTFILFNQRGEKVDEFLYALNRARVVYWVDRLPSL